MDRIKQRAQARFYFMAIETIFLLGGSVSTGRRTAKLLLAEKVNNSLITGQNPYAYTDNTVDSGKSYEYRLEAVLADESTEILGTASCAPAPPAFAITKLYPNPASDVLNIALTLPQAGEVTLELYDLSGRVVSSKNIQAVSAGELSEKLDVSGLANGVYTLRATQMNETTSERVVVVR